MSIAAALIVLALLAPAPASADSSDPVLIDDVQFAENLARFRYFDLAFNVLGDIKLRKLDANEKGAVEFAEASINKRASESTADVERQLKFQAQAIELLTDWAKPGTPYVYHDKRPDALRTLGDALQARGRLRTLQLKAAEASQAETLRTLAEADFKQSHEVRVLLQREYDDLTKQAEDQGKLDAAARSTELSVLTIYDRGLNAMDWAEVSQDREYRLEQAYEQLGDYQWELTEESIGQYFAVHYQGVVQHRLGKLQDALELQREVLDKGQYFWENLLDNPVAAPFVAELFDRAWGEIASIQAEQGELQAADATIETMLSEHSKARAPYGRPGFGVLLGWAEQLQALGKGSEALDIVKLVADQGAAVPEGEQARGLLATMVTGKGAGDAGDASASVLMAAAKGLYDRKDFSESAFVYTRAAAAIANGQERTDFLVSAWLGAGRGYQSDKRYLEAALAFETALEAAVAQKADAATQESAALGMYNNFDRRFRETTEDFDKALKDQASSRLIKMGIEANIAFLEARESFDAAAASSPPDKGAFEAALDELKGVTADAPSYESALVYQARALAGAGRTGEALATFDSVLKRTTDPANAPANAEAKGRREVALGQALYYKADLLLSDALARPADALTVLGGFEEKLAGQQGLVENVKYQRVLAHCMLGDVEAATKAAEDLKSFRAESTLLRIAWFRLSEALQKAGDAARAKGDTAAANDMLLRAADALWASAELGGFPSFSNLLSIGEWYVRVGKPDLAQRSYAKALEVFGKEGSSIKPEQLDEARLGLALAYNVAREFGKARPYWQDLVKRKANDQRVLIGAARGFGGWLEVAPDGSIVEVPGSGDFGEAFSLWGKLFTSAQAQARQQRIWWESKLGTIYAKYREGSANPKSFTDSRTILTNVTVLYSNYDEDTLSSLPAEQQYSPSFKPLFKYLEKKIPSQ